MMNSDYELDTTRRDAPLRISARGRAVLANPMTNRGTAFTVQERRYLGLVGLMPSEVTPIGNQVRRVYQQYHSARTPFAKNNYLASLRDRNEVLFYRLLADHIEEMLPIIYTPTIGEVIERFSVEYHRPRGVFISIDRPEDIEQSLLDHGLAAGDVHRLRGHPRDRRPRHRRHRDCHRQALGLHRGGRDPPAPGHAGRP